jgi:hypothetical protein
VFLVSLIKGWIAAVYCGQRFYRFAEGKYEEAAPIFEVEIVSAASWFRLETTGGRWKADVIRGGISRM